MGARIWLDELCERDDITPFVALFSESTGRVLVSVPRSEEVRFTDMCTARGFPHARIGVTDGTGPEAALDIQGLFAVPLSQLRTAWSRTLPDAFDA